ncbi:MAG: alpha/beta hydrolase [Acidimicrobiales bacterium]
MTTAALPVPFDRELDEALVGLREQGFARSEAMTLEGLLLARERFGAGFEPADVIGDRPVVHEQRVVAGPAGSPEITLLVVRPKNPEPGAPGIYEIHGGGMIMGSRWMAFPDLVHDAATYGAVGVSVEYRLAPEHPDPAPSEDCYTGLLWMFEHAEELGIDPGRIIVRGASAGGGLSAAVALMARDRKGPELAGQMLICPMIDDRNGTVSAHQYESLGIWSGGTNSFAWSALLGDRCGQPGVSVYAAPSRAEDLSDLPPAFIEVGAAEVFRDEDVEYASRIWSVGGQAELHVWDGCFHAFYTFVPQASVSKAALESRTTWLKRILGV